MPSEHVPKHRKSRAGCERCKARKVKCNEARPKCHACTRHRVECVYLSPAPPGYHRHDSDPRTTAKLPATLHALPIPAVEADYPTPASSNGAAYSSFEMRMLHWFVAKTADILSASTNLWRIRAPLVAFDCPPVFDILVALATLHMIREKQHGPPPSQPRAWGQYKGGESFIDTQNIDELRLISEQYFQRAVQTHRAAVNEATTVKENEGLFIGAILIAVYALFMLGDGEATSKDYDETVWFKLSIGPREIGWKWMVTAGKNVLSDLGIDDDEPNILADPELENPKYAQALQPLLDLGRDFENITPEDEKVYREVVIYVGLMYHMVITQSESPRATCRRIFALTSKLPPRFKDLVFEQRPRALALLLVVFAIGKLIEDHLVLLKGIATNQIPAIYARLPSAWKELMKWPLDVLQTDTTDPKAWPKIYFGR